MSTINSKTARELLEAYHAVYQTEETITEEQLWEEVENWVNSLIEEGYDLSEYTWEDMYEAYIEEQRLSGPERRAQQDTLRQQGGPLGQRRAEVQARGLRGQGNRLLRKPGDPGRTSQPTTRIQRDAGAPAPTPPTAKTAPTPPTAKTAPTPPTAKTAPKPAPSAPKPAPSAPKPAPTAATKTAPAPAKQMTSRPKTPNPLMQRTFGYQTGGAPGQSGFKKATITPNVTGMKSGRLATAISGPNKKIGEGYDAYDIVLNYIAENGHAESLDEAHYIMMEMSPEMIQDIVTDCEVVNFLYAEGYAETLEDAEWMMANLIDEEAIDIIVVDEGYKPLPTDRMAKKVQDKAVQSIKTVGGLAATKKSDRLGRQAVKMADVLSTHDPRSSKAREDSNRAKRTVRHKSGAKIPKNEAFEAWLDEAMTKYEKNRRRAAQRAAARNAARDQGKTGVVPGVGYVSPRRERETWTDESGQERHTSGARMPKKK